MKFHPFQIYDGGGSHLEQSKDRSISATDRPISTKFNIMMCLDPPNLLTKNTLLKTQHGGQLSSGKSKKIMIKSKSFGPISAEF